MEISQISLNNSLMFLAYASGVIVLLVGGFLAKLIIDCSKLTKNINETTTIVKNELEPTLKELTDSIQTINRLMKNTDRNVDKFKKIASDAFGLSSTAFSKARVISGAMLKGVIKGISLVTKLLTK